MDAHELMSLRGEQAQQLLANPIFEAAFTDTRKAILETWAAVETSDTERAYDLHRMLKCLDRVKRCINTHIDTGKLAEKEIAARKRLFKRG